MISRWDRAVVEAFQDARWGPANQVAIHLSDWWVKSLVILAVALVADLVWHRFPVGIGLTALSYVCAVILSYGLKGVFDRRRPPLADPAVHPLVAVPHSASMPSGHATSSFAAAFAVGLVHPKLRWPMLALATLISLSRVWLGVHYLSDVIVGAALGIAIAWGLWWLSRAAGRAFRARARTAA